jgi:AraC-like DNA-binding protein
MGQQHPSNRRWWKLNSQELSSEYLPHKNCTSQLLPVEAGVGYSDTSQLDQGLSCIETSYTPSKDLAVVNRFDTGEPRLIVTLALQGCSRFIGAEGEEIYFSEGNTTMTTFASSMGERHYQADLPTLQIRFAISKIWFNNYFGEEKSNLVFGNKTIQLLSQRPTSALSKAYAQQLLTCNMSPEMRRMFLQGQALSILSSELNALFDEESGNPAKMTPKDKQIAEAARDILLTEFKTPPTVEDLSKRVGTNQCKLKQVFHHFFNNTPYGILMDIRMNHAYQMLKSTRCPVSVAAESVGYNHASNFSAAFAKYFGISPKQISRTC